MINLVQITASNPWFGKIIICHSEIHILIFAWQLTFWHVVRHRPKWVKGVIRHIWRVKNCNKIFEKVSNYCTQRILRQSVLCIEYGRMLVTIRCWFVYNIVVLHEIWLSLAIKNDVCLYLFSVPHQTNINPSRDQR